MGLPASGSGPRTALPQVIIMIDDTDANDALPQAPGGGAQEEGD